MSCRVYYRVWQKHHNDPVRPHFITSSEDLLRAIISHRHESKPKKEKKKPKLGDALL